MERQGNASIAAHRPQMTPLKTLHDLTEIVKGYLPDDAVKLVERAYHYAENAHNGQFRLSGDPYISHPVAVACILAELKQDGATLAAALLHDTVEDSGVTEKQLEDEFGPVISNLVAGVTKLGKIYFGSKEEQQAENFRKMFLAMAQDIRVVIIKLADRLHNMRTLRHLPHHVQLNIARETRDIFSPLAHRLGMWSLKWALEDLAFQTLQPDDFQYIKKLVASKRVEREAYVENLLTKIRELMAQYQVKADVSGRPKHFYSIYTKLKKQNISFDDLYDTLGIRIIVDSIKQCYEVLGLIHSVYKPVNARFKDYIAMPKSNLYQSLHTTVIGPQGLPVEVQIRTKDMHQIAEEGIAAHWRYKAGSKPSKFDADFTWLRQIVEAQKEKTAPTDFLQELKVDLFIDEVFVFTPKGDVQMLPKGSTPVDFAFKIHTQIGYCCVGAKVNNYIVPLNHPLKSGDRVEVLTSKTEKPKIDWLKFVATAVAKRAIKQWIKKQSQAENVEKGRQLLEKLAIANNRTLADFEAGEIQAKIFDKFHCKKMDEVYLLIALAEISAKDVLSILHPVSSLPAPPRRVPTTGAPMGVSVMGEGNIGVNLAKCCNPLPGDGIVGFVTRGSGVTVHRTNCRHIVSLGEKDLPRLIEVNWTAQPIKHVYPVIIEVEAFDRIGILKDIIGAVTGTTTNIREVNTKTMAEGGRMKAYIVVDIKDITHFNHIKTALNKVSDVYAIKRSTYKGRIE